MIPVAELAPGSRIRATKNGPIHEVLWFGRGKGGNYVVIYAGHPEPVVYHPAATLWPAEEPCPSL